MKMSVGHIIYGCAMTPELAELLNDWKSSDDLDLVQQADEVLEHFVEVRNSSATTLNGYLGIHVGQMMGGSANPVRLSSLWQSLKGCLSETNMRRFQEMYVKLPVQVREIVDVPAFWVVWGDL